MTSENSTRRHVRETMYTLIACNKWKSVGGRRSYFHFAARIGLIVHTKPVLPM
jgi:hypothetical protein